MLTVIRGSPGVSCCPALLLPVVDPVWSKGQRRSHWSMKNSQPCPGLCAEGLGTAEISYVLGKTLAWPLCVYTDHREMDSGSDTAFLDGFRPASLARPPFPPSLVPRPCCLVPSLHL